MRAAAGAPQTTVAPRTLRAHRRAAHSAVQMRLRAHTALRAGWARDASHLAIWKGAALLGARCLVIWVVLHDEVAPPAPC